MKKAYTILLTALCVLILSWFLPWLYSLILPVSANDPFVACSPLNNEMIVSQHGTQDKAEIFAVDAHGNPTGETFTREQRDSLLPQIYYTQLMARNALPDTIDGIEMSMSALRHNAWVFSSLPRDINKVMPEVFLIMESMPARIDLEDPTEIFRFRNGRVEFVDMGTNAVNEARTKRFTDIFHNRDFKLPVHSFSANITSRKPYDNGYLMVDDGGDIYHLKMQAGRPYFMKLIKPDTLVADRVFVMENNETRHLGFVTDTNHNLYIIETEGYRIVPLPVGKFDPEKDRISVVKNVFNTVVKINDGKTVQWTAISSDDYSPIGSYAFEYPVSASEKAEAYIFPFSLSFTSVNDCVAKPRFEDWSLKALFLNAALAIVLAVVWRRRRHNAACTASCFAVTLVFGIFAFIPLIIIRN